MGNYTGAVCVCSYGDTWNCTHVYIHTHVVDMGRGSLYYTCTHTHTCRGSKEMNTLVGYTATVHWGVGGGRGVSVGGVSQLRSLDIFEPLSSSESSS